jgi:hypothetical protein
MIPQKQTVCIGNYFGTITALHEIKTYFLPSFLYSVSFFLLPSRVFLVVTLLMVSLSGHYTTAYDVTKFIFSEATVVGTNMLLWATVDRRKYPHFLSTLAPPPTTDEVQIYWGRNTISSFWENVLSQLKGLFITPKNLPEKEVVRDSLSPAGMNDGAATRILRSPVVA